LEPGPTQPQTSGPPLGFFFSLSPFPRTRPLKKTTSPGGTETSPGFRLLVTRNNGVNPPPRPRKKLMGRGGLNQFFTRKSTAGPPPLQKNRWGSAKWVPRSGVRRKVKPRGPCRPAGPQKPNPVPPPEGVPGNWPRPPVVGGRMKRQKRRTGLGLLPPPANPPRKPPACLIVLTGPPPCKIRARLVGWPKNPGPPLDPPSRSLVFVRRTKPSF